MKKIHYRHSALRKPHYMQRHLLVYNINDYPEMGGGLAIEWYESLALMDKGVNDLLTKHSEKFTIIVAAQINQEYQYIPQEKITILQRQK